MENPSTNPVPIQGESLSTHRSLHSHPHLVASVCTLHLYGSEALIAHHPSVEGKGVKCTEPSMETPSAERKPLHTSHCVSYQELQKLGSECECPLMGSHEVVQHRGSSSSARFPSWDWILIDSPQLSISACSPVSLLSKWRWGLSMSWLGSATLLLHLVLLSSCCVFQPCMSGDQGPLPRFWIWTCHLPSTGKATTCCFLCL